MHSAMDFLLKILAQVMDMKQHVSICFFKVEFLDE